MVAGSEIEFALDMARLGAQSIAVLPFANRSNRDDDRFNDLIRPENLGQAAHVRD